MSLSKLKKETIYQFTKADGYSIARKQGIRAAAVASGLSRPTVYTILEEHPKQTIAAEQNLLEKWNNQAGTKKFPK